VRCGEGSGKGALPSKKEILLYILYRVGI